MEKRFIHKLRKFSTPKNIFLNLAIAIIYIVSGKIGLSFASINPSASSIWPPTGIALASVLIFGNKTLPAIFIGAFGINLLTAGTIVTSLAIATGNSLEAFVGAYLVRHFSRGLETFDRLQDILKFSLLSGIVSTTIGATVGVTTLTLGNLASPDQFKSIWLTWWLGDMGGILILAPFIIAWSQNIRILTNLKETVHFLISFLLLTVVTVIIFQGTIPFPYLSIPVAVWIAFWFGQKGATVATILVAVISIFYTLHNLGPFAPDYPPEQSLQLLQLFLAIFSLTSLTFAALVVTITRSQKTIEANEKRFRSLIENSFDAIVLIDPTSKIIYASPSVKHILGYSPDELQGTNGFDLVAPWDRARTAKILSDLINKPGGTVTTEYQTIRKDKKIIWIEVTGTNLLHEPDVGAVIINFHDISATKVYEDRILREKLEDEAMLGSIGEGIIATDDKGKITLINQAACNDLGFEKKQLLGKLVVDVIPMLDVNGHPVPKKERPMAKVLSMTHGDISSKSNFYVRQDNSHFPIDFTLTPILLNKKVVGTIEVFHNITREREVDKAKSEFVSLASHQLRTPLTTINWCLDEIVKNKAEFTPKVQRYLDDIMHASHRMVDLINALLNASRLELGTFIAEIKDTDLLETMDSTLKEFDSQIKSKNISVEKIYPPDHLKMVADPKLLAMIFQNLLSNAVKYSKNSGTIKITVSKDNKGYYFSVQDNGYGIQQNQQASIFSKLFRADNARKIDPEGTGLGLYIAKSITDATGGQIRFESQENKGTIFYVSFPLSGMKSKDGQKQLF